MIGDQLSTAANQTKELATKSFDYYRLKLFAFLAGSLSWLSRLAIMGILFTIALLFVTIGLALHLSEQLDSPLLGFFIVGAFFLLLMGVFYAFKQKIEDKLVQRLSKEYFDEELL